MKSNSVKLFTVSVSMVLLSACTAERSEIKQAPIEQKNAEIGDLEKVWPRLDIKVKQDPKIELQVKSLLQQMSLEQKIAQMIQPAIRDITVEDMRKYGFGSYLNGGGSFPTADKKAPASDWINLAEAMYQASIDDSIDGSTIPTMWGTDAVHGHNNVIGATLFPHNIGLGAMNNPALVEQIAAATAKEVMVTGIDWVFAPTVAVVRDDRWGRTYEGYSEDPEIVRSYAASVVKGLQGTVNHDFLGDSRVISTVKHFIGDGGTEKGDDQGDNIASEQALFDLHAQGYVGGLTAGAQSVMASFNSWHGKKNHGSKYLLTDVLKERMGFDGFVVGDWNGHGQVAGCTNESCVQAVNAGLDIFMVPTAAWKPLYHNLIAQVKAGDIELSRIDDAVTRILRVKIRAGLFTKPSPANRLLSGKTEIIGNAQHRDVARQAVRESLVLLKNNDQLLPLSPTQTILVAGDGADNIGKQAGGWSISWQGTGNKNTDFPGATSIYQGIEQVARQAGGQANLSVDGSFTKKPDVAIVVFGEDPYAEGHGDIDNLEYQRGNKRDLALLKRLKAQGIPVVSLFISGRPMWVNAELNASDAFVAAWLPGTEGDGVAQVIMAKADGEVNYPITGKLSFSWPSHRDQTMINRGDSYSENHKPLFTYGYGLGYGDIKNLSNTLDESVDASTNGASPVVLFERAPKTPWRSFISSGKQRQVIESSQQTFGALSVKAIDKVVQEDARLLTFDGSAAASYQLISNFPEDLRAIDEAGSVLVTTIKLIKPPTANVTLAMSCEHDACDAPVDITKQLSAMAIDSWQTVAVDLQCFNNAGADMAKIVSPFTLGTVGKLGIALSAIKLQPKKAVKAHWAIDCP